MKTLTEQILAHTNTQPEGAPIAAKGLLHLGKRAALDQALKRLVERGQLIRAGRGLYMRPIETRFGARTPSIEQALAALGLQRSEVIVPTGAAAANALGLTTQAPVRPVFLTSGRKRTITLGKQQIELQHAPKWQLALGNRRAGQAIRALAWLGPSQVEKASATLKEKLAPEEKAELAAAAPQLPNWLAASVARIAYG